jgi:hypothetical protein
MNTRIKALTVAPGATGIEKIAADVLGQAVAVKAASTNAKNIKVAGSKSELEAGNYWPLLKGEQLSIDFKGPVWFQLEESTDKFHVLTVLPS